MEKLVIVANVEIIQAHNVHIGEHAFVISNLKIPASHVHGPPNYKTK